MNIRGKLYAESPVYRGNARKTLFTRDGDGKHRLVSLAGDISGTAQSLMDAFIGQSRNGKNTGLLNQLWARLYGTPLPDGLIRKVECTLQKSSYPRGNFFDLRMGIKLDEDRWAAEANANYKMETVFRNSVFDLTLIIGDDVLKRQQHKAQLHYLLQELVEGRFWFGAGKSKGLGRFRLELESPFSAPDSPPKLNTKANHLRLSLAFNAENPVLVGWNWGKVDAESPSFAAVDGRLLVEAMRDLPDAIRQRLAMSLGGPILNPDNWKKKLAEHLPRVLAIWLQEQVESQETTRWVLSSSELTKLGKGKYALPNQIIDALKCLADQPFSSQEEIESAITEAMTEKPNMVKRVLKSVEQQQGRQTVLSESLWTETARVLGLTLSPKKVKMLGTVVEEENKFAAKIKHEVTSHLEDEAGLTRAFTTACQVLLPRLYQQIDHQINLLQSDTWVDEEIANREEHLRIKQLLREGVITRQQWGNHHQVPKGVKAAAWREFLNAHRRLNFQHLLNARNLEKSIVNDENMILFLKSYRSRTRQELAQPYNIDFRIGGASKREVSRKYGKPYDTIFMRMLSWIPSSQEQGAWEVYIPGSTIKGAFRRRASQVLKTLWGDTSKTTKLLNRLFGAQGQRGLVFFSDAYLADPADPNRSWCSMDGVKMDPKTGGPVETAKHDYLYAYGEQLVFQCHLDVQDIRQQDLEALSLLSHLIQDFARGDIPVGGEKTSGFGWVEAQVKKLHWLTAKESKLHQQLFQKASLQQEGLWHSLSLEGTAAVEALSPIRQYLSLGDRKVDAPPKANAGFISHRAFGGYCGMLFVDAEVLTPLCIQESGEPSFSVSSEDGPINGWDFFSMSPPEAEQRDPNRVYALPSKSLKGMLRHLYSIASDSQGTSRNISQLNLTDKLFGWVGQGPNQALMGRLSFSFGAFDNPQMAWFKAPYPYGGWQYANGEWTHDPEAKSVTRLVNKQWRLFPHAPLAPCVQQLPEFEPDTAQASYFHAILPGNRACFTIRFWNLEKEELQRLIWTVGLEEGLAHKLGKHRYLGFGSLCLRILPDSYLIDWAARYSGKADTEWQRPLNPAEWIHPQAIAHYKTLRKALNVKKL